MRIAMTKKVDTTFIQIVHTCLLWIGCPQENFI